MKFDILQKSVAFVWKETQEKLLPQVDYYSETDMRPAYKTCWDSAG